MVRSTAAGPDLEVVRDELADSAGSVPAEAEASEQFGLRISWQSEAERIEAAEFLLATRMQEDTRRRSAAAALAVREQAEADLKTALHHRPAS